MANDTGNTVHEQEAPVRQDLVDRVRRELKTGTYNCDEDRKLGIAVDRMLEDDVLGLREPRAAA